jgi:hypothetical protein
MAARLQFQGLPLPAPHLYTVPRPKGPVYRLRGRWPFIYVMPQDATVYRHAGRSSLTSWGMFRAARAMPGRDVLVAAALIACLARESRELIHDISHHRRTSVGHAHCYSMSSQCLGQTGQECAFIVLFLSYGYAGHAPRLHLCHSSGAVGPIGAYPGNHNSVEGLIPPDEKPRVIDEFKG